MFLDCRGNDCSEISPISNKRKTLIVAYFHLEITLGWFESILTTFPEELPCFSDLKSFASANDSQANGAFAQPGVRGCWYLSTATNPSVTRCAAVLKWCLCETDQLWFTSTDNTSNSNQCPPSIARPQWAALWSDQWPGYAWLLFSLLLLKGINMMRFTLQQIFYFFQLFLHVRN